MTFWHRHKWTDWAIIDRGVTLSFNQEVGWYTVQERYCTGCGKTQVDDQAHYSGHGASWCNRQSRMPQRALRKDGVSA